MHIVSLCHNLGRTVAKI